MKNTEKGRGRKKEKIRIKIFNKLDDERLLMLFPPAPLALSFIREKKKKKRNENSFSDYVQGVVRVASIVGSRQ